MNEVFTEKYYKSSFFYRLISKFRDGILSFTDKAVSFSREKFGSSYTFALIDLLLKHGILSLDIFLALFIGAMLVMPHNLWNNLFAVLAAMFFAVWSAIEMAKKRRSGVSFRLPLSILVFAVAIVTSVIFAPALGTAAKAGLFMISALILMGSVIIAVDSKKKLIRFLSIVLFFVSIAALYGVYQGIVGVEINEEFVDIYENEGMPGRVYSFFQNPNNFAEILILYIPFFAALFFILDKKREKTVVIAGFVICFAALLLTYSRSSWVGFALAAVVFITLYDKRLLIPLIILALAAVPFLPESILNRILTIGSLEDSSNSYRLYIWESCLSMIKDCFITGVGMGNEAFRSVYYGYASSVAITAMHAHMLYLELILETGIMGFLGFMGYMYGTLKNGVRALVSAGKDLKFIIISAISSVFGIAFVACVEYIWFYPRVMFAFFIVPAVLAAAVRVSSSCEEEGEQ